MQINMERAMLKIHKIVPDFVWRRGGRRKAGKAML